MQKSHRPMQKLLHLIFTRAQRTNPPGSPGFDPNMYNPRFVYWCYKTYLQRVPDEAGWQYWTSVLNSEGDYGHIIEAFQVCVQYRDRF